MRQTKTIYSKGSCQFLNCFPQITHMPCSMPSAEMKIEHYHKNEFYAIYTI
jgi:hypothetical protein